MDLPKRYDMYVCMYQKLKSTQLQRTVKITEINEYDIFGERHGQPAKLNYEISTM